MTTKGKTPDRGRHLRGAERAQLAQGARELYEAGLSIRRLCAVWGGVSFGRMHRLLIEAGTPMRPQYQGDRFRYTGKGDKA